MKEIDYIFKNIHVEKFLKLIKKRGKDYVGCRTETLSKVETCYIMELIKAE